MSSLGKTTPILMRHSSCWKARWGLNSKTDRTVQLSEGEMIVVSRGEEHKPFASEECRVLLVEPKGVVNTGDAGGQLTAENDVWI